MPKLIKCLLGYLLEHFKLSFVPWIIITSIHFGASQVLSGKESACQCRRCMFNPGMGRIPWRRKWQPTPVFLPRKSHGQRSLAGYSPWSVLSICAKNRRNIKHLLSISYVPSTKSNVLCMHCLIRPPSLWSFVSRVMSLLFNTLSRFFITFLPRSNCLLISWLQSPSAVILEP